MIILHGKIAQSLTYDYSQLGRIDVFNYEFPLSQIQGGVDFKTALRCRVLFLARQLCPLNSLNRTTKLILHEYFPRNVFTYMLGDELLNSIDLSQTSLAFHA